MGTPMNLEEARKFQEQWLAAQPKWPQREEHPLVALANEAHNALPEEAKVRLMRNALELTVTERFEQHKIRLDLIFAYGAECRSEEDFIQLLYPGL